MSNFLEKLQSVRFDMSKRLLITIILFTGALLITTIGVLTVRIDLSDAQRIEGELQSELERFNDPRFIFGNNLFHTLVMFVPIVGPIWGGIVLFNTGTIIAILGIAYGVPPILTFFSLFFTPVFWLEFIVYSVAMAESVVLLLQIIRGRGRLEASRMCILVTICASVLLLSAGVEWIMINFV
jgi:hypothetical protein